MRTKSKGALWRRYSIAVAVFISAAWLVQTASATTSTLDVEQDAQSRHSVMDAGRISSAPGQKATAAIVLAANSRNTVSAAPASTATPMLLNVEAEDLVKKGNMLIAGGQVSSQQMARFGSGWSGGAQLFWSGGAVGAVLDLSIDVPVAASYAVELYPTRAPDYGQVKIQVDGVDTPIVMDNYAPRVMQPTPRQIGKFGLTREAHKISFMIVGKNRSASGYLFGLDRIRLYPSGPYTRDAGGGTGSAAPVNKPTSTRTTAPAGIKPGRNNSALPAVQQQTPQPGVQQGQARMPVTQNQADAAKLKDIVRQMVPAGGFDASLHRVDKLLGELRALKARTPQDPGKNRETATQLKSELLELHRQSDRLQSGFKNLDQYVATGNGEQYAKQLGEISAQMYRTLDSQESLAELDLQNMLSQQSRLQQTIAGITKAIHDTQTSMMRKY